jgi:hypothetical protein
MRFIVPFSDVATGAVADTFGKTLAAVRAADTAGYRCRIRRLAVGCSDNAPPDLAIALVLKRVDDVSAGGAGTSTAVTPTQRDSLSRAAVCTAGKGHTVEPTVYGEPLFQTEMNLRNTIIQEWDAEGAPVANRDQLIGLLAAPRTAVAHNLSGELEFEEF